MTARRFLLALPRPMAALILMASLFVPSLLAAIPQIEGQPAQCGMACCKRSGTCCCRKSQAHKRNGTAWRAYARCRGACDGPAPAPRPAARALAQTRYAVEPAPGSVHYSNRPRRALLSNGAVSGLFGRPPPAA